MCCVEYEVELTETAIDEKEDLMFRSQIVVFREETLEMVVSREMWRRKKLN